MAIATREALLSSAKQELLESFPESSKHFEWARALIPDANVRARLFWPIPVQIHHGEGSRVWDIDGREYIDCVCGFGPMILGHRHPEVSAALNDQLSRGIFFGPPVVTEGELAERIVDHVPGAERVLLLNSGTEATLAALRIARAASGKDKIAKFEGGWHGWHDFALYSVAKAEGDPENAITTRDSLGIIPSLCDYVVALPYNDPAAFDRIRREASGLACVIVEGMQGGSGMLPGDPAFVQRLAAVCAECNVLLVLDEVITGFRFGLSGAAGVFNIEADLTTLGKIIGGGMPAGAVCGRADLMDLVIQADPFGSASGNLSVLLAGTFSGHPMTMTAGKAQLDVLIRQEDTIYPKLEDLGQRLRDGLEEALDEVGVPGYVTGAGSLWGLHFTAEKPTSIRTKQQINKEAAAALSGYLLKEGVFVSAPMHLGFLSAAHTKDDVDHIVSAHIKVLATLKTNGFFA